MTNEQDGRTPRTNALLAERDAFGNSSHSLSSDEVLTNNVDCLTDLARQLERELAAERARTEGLERKHEHDILQVIDERDAAEETVSTIYFNTLGRSPEWSNLFGHKEAIEEIDDAVELLRAAEKQHALSRPEPKGETKPPDAGEG